MKSRTLSAAALILLTPLVVSAFQAQADQVRKGELKGRSFTSGPLKITLAEFHGRGIIYPRGRITIVVENRSDEFTTFDPRRLSFIEKSGAQVDILGLQEIDGSREWLIAADDKRIGPKAWIRHDYALTADIRLPTRLYYEDKLLATIIE
jgi:hypothetical protein